jgi:hypothetical protein
MFDRSDRGFHSSSQILPAGTHISHPLATQGYLYVSLRETQHTIRPALERQGSTRATERTAIAVSGLESGALAMLFSPSGHICIGSTAKADLAGDDVAPKDVQPIGHQANTKISHLANSEITQMADAPVSRLCYTVGRGRINDSSWGNVP